MSETATATDLAALTGTWTIDAAHSRLGFSTKHAMVTTVRGHFKEFEGTLYLDGASPEKSTANVTIQAASFDSGVADRDAHVRGADFLDVENYPTLTFVSTGVSQDDDEYEMTGDLTIRGATRPVTLKLEFEGSSQDPFGNTRAGFTGTTTISRKDFGLTWNAVLETGGVLVSDKIKIQLDVSAIKTG
ncbi:MAG: YceI family protein [Frankia sp.]|nr:YceI family protein [Frankia sp.]